MLAIYPACFYKEQDGQYTVIFPDLNHLATCGANLQDAMSMAIDCLAGYSYEAKLSNEVLPPPSDIKDINPDDEYTDYAETFVNIISVDVELYAKEHFNKAVKKTLTIPKWLNDAAIAKQLNFSKILQDALKRELNIC